ncbi:MAG TPA: CAP domain-containing protein, partial [Candidatus Saccharimonadales bacterium]|nr:CAP domain-containing protein [Candidatus Saccharimonadales bacterium]
MKNKKTSPARKTRQTVSKTTSLRMSLHPHIKYLLFIFMATGLLMGNFYMWFGPRVSATAEGYPWYYEEQQFLPIVNSFRAGISGLPMLSTSDCLTRAARDWSRQMASTNQLVHSPEGFTNTYCDNSSAGAENILYLADRFTASAQQAFDVWVNSPWHQLNMRTDYTHTGIGFYWDEGHQKMWATQLFAACESGNCPASMTNPSPAPSMQNNATCREVHVPTTVKAGETFRPMLIWNNVGTSTWFDTYK